MTHHHRRQEVDAGTHTTALSLAVRLVDGVTGERPLGRPAVAVANPDTGRVRPDAINGSGYWLFLDVDLPADPLQMVIDGGHWYADDRVERSRPTDGPPAVVVDLAPAPSYPFGRGSTIVRGVVLDAAEEGVENALVTVQGLDRRTRTTADGEFVLFLGDQHVESVTGTDQRRVTVGGDDPVLEVLHDLGDLSAPVAMAPGEVTKHTFRYV